MQRSSLCHNLFTDRVSKHLCKITKAGTKATTFKVIVLYSDATFLFSFYVYNASENYFVSERICEVQARVIGALKLKPKRFTNKCIQVWPLFILLVCWMWDLDWEVDMISM